MKFTFKINLFVWRKIFNVSLVALYDVYRMNDKNWNIVEKKIIPTHLKLLIEISCKFTYLGFIDADTFIYKKYAIYV